MNSMYTLIIDEHLSAGLQLPEAVKRADEALLPEQERRAAANRRAFAHLMGGAQ